MQMDTFPKAMDTSDVDMESASAPAPESAAGDNRQLENAWGFLSRARQLLAEGNPTLALQSVLSAIRTEGGEQAVLRAMSRAREMYRQRAQSDADMGELTALLAQCAIDEASASGPTAVSNPYCGPGHNPSELLTSPDAILAESGRRQVILDAFADGSSFICLKCGGLFSSSRKDAHLANWCQ
ncbi:hypothetical protein LUZ63_006983 [Rhynchospora breviuscula]|uniref:C2HC zinc finger plants domain-containing protein n=1 Tax=Rhynchospora breviuscula TaxID=2022672 RepID=A0A9Q0HU14_9POAL|nr:hypothetical protein LUZ63_006983 [Rhynchospora breviuscula]